MKREPIYQTPGGPAFNLMLVVSISPIQDPEPGFAHASRVYSFRVTLLGQTTVFEFPYSSEKAAREARATLIAEWQSALEES